MRKYWYYTYVTNNGIGCGISYSDDGEFDIIRAIHYLQNANNLDVRSIVITYWKEISYSFYEKINKHLDEIKK